MAMLHAYMLRSESTRIAELSDLCCVNMDNESRDSDCIAMILLITSGKTIDKKDGMSPRNIHYHRVLRDRSALLCPIGALAAWVLPAVARRLRTHPGLQH